METEFAPVRTKANFVQRYAAGEFGNAAPTWLDVNDYLASGYDEPVHLRNRAAGGPTYYNLPGPVALLSALADRDPAGYYVSAMAPTEQTILQGEVQLAVPGSGRVGLELYYTTVKKPMRTALTERAATAHGIIADSLIVAHLCPNSQEWLSELIARYPGHVVEFSTYSVRWGTLFPKFNTVFWEVRLY